MKLHEFHCAQCFERYEADLNAAQFSAQISMIQGKTIENRMYFAKCPHCGEVNTFSSDKREEWGNQKSVNVKRLKWMFGGSCLLALIVIALVFYFAGQGIVTIVDWFSK